MELHIKHRGKTVQLPEAPCSEDLVSEFRTSIAATLDADVDKTRILWKGRQVGRDEDEKKLGQIFGKGGTILVVASAKMSIQQLTQGGPDVTLVDDIGHGPAPRFVATPRRTPSSSVHSLGGGEYGFGSIEALPGFSDAHEVEAILHRLSTDRGILSAMRERRWRVGALKEMPPQGRVGVDPVCVLGYNVNRGQEIRLRVRTDDRKGFRSIAQLLHVLAHELAHNVRDEHDDEFKETMRWVERKIKHVDWRGAGGHVLSDGSVARAIPTSRIAASSQDATRHNTSVSNVAALSRLVTEARIQQEARQKSKRNGNQNAGSSSNQSRPDEHSPAK